MSGQSLSVLDLSSRGFGPASAMIAIQLIQATCPELAKLSLDHNSMSAAGAFAIGSMLRGNSRLKVPHPQLPVPTPTLTSPYSNTRYQISTHAFLIPKELHLRYTGTGVSGAIAIAESLRHNTCLEKLYLVSSVIGSDGAFAFEKVSPHK